VSRENRKLLSHPTYDHLYPPRLKDPLSLHDVPTFAPQATVQRQQEAASARPENPHPGWGGRRPGTGVKPGTMNNLQHGRRSALISHAVHVLAEHKELRPFLLLISRAAVQGEIPQTTRQLIIQELQKTTFGMQIAARELKRLRDGEKV
jgi:hypothetical protein